ncbi:MAG: response regulator [Treponema sp.]|nr:response regulator [Treponema sp.]
MNPCKKILMVDDDLINLEFFEVMLTKLGFIVEKANDGVEALEQVKRFYPDLIMLDTVIPRMSGWELTRYLKQEPQFRQIPIIMFSALDDVKDKVEGFEMGVDDYITKPFNFSEVLARIRAVLRNRELFAQIAVRESRLDLAEELSADMKNNMGDFVKSIDELESAIGQISQNAATLAPVLEVVMEKTQVVRKYIAEVDARIEKTILAWKDLKKNEIGLTVLESQIRSPFHQE